LFIGLLALFTHAGLASEKPSRPDVVFILLDDQRWDAMSFLGHPYIETPNINKLRQEGVYMENAFVTTSICCPSRATFLTGTGSQRH
jgi:N-acetylglucosamine-6-sulfatase